MTKYTAKNVLLQLEDGTKVLPYTDKLSRDLSNITVDGENKLIASRVYRAKDVLSDVRGAEELEKEKRSTFDRSKFTVVGSPTITDDGIASGFSNGNYLNTNYSLNLNSNSFKIICEFTTGDNIDVAGTAINVFGNDNTKVRCFIYEKKLVFACFGKQIYSSTSFLSPNKKIRCVCTYDGTKGSIEWHEVGSEEITESHVTSGFAPVAEYYIISIGLNSKTFDGSFDLKQFSITVDGVEVFNGNKTGIDQIKGNYTVSGTPTIDAGVLKNADSENYITSNYTLSLGTVNEIYGSFSCPDSSSNLELFTLGGSHLRTVCSETGLKLQLWTNGSIASPSEIPFGDYEYKVTFSNTQLTNLQYREKGLVNWQAVGNAFLSLNLTNWVTNAKTPATIKWDNVTNGHGSIDLNTFKIYKDSVLMFQLCLEIPYFLSKTGNKIVDATYRDRVQDMYEQFGYTHYYTIGDEPEKYNVGVVGSPTLVGGVASGFSSGNYIYGNTTDVVSLVKQSDNWSITCKTNTKNLTSNIPIFSFGDTFVGNDYPMAYINTYGTMKLRIRPTGTTATTELNWGGVKSFLSSNENILVTISYQNGRYKGLLVKENGIEHSFDYGEYSNTEFTGNYAHFTVFNGNSENVGSIDLSQFSITVDGKEVYRAYEPTIPNAYTFPTNSAKYAPALLYPTRSAGFATAKFLIADKQNLTVKGKTSIVLGNGEYMYFLNDQTFTITDLLDTGSALTAGKDYYVYATNDQKLVVSLDATAPSGYTTYSATKIGGFHTICRTVTSSNAPVLITTSTYQSFWSTHPAIGYTAGDAIPISTWTIAHRPYSSPEGMVYVSGDYGEEPFWADIYLQSGTGVGTKSAFGATITNSRNPIAHQFDMNHVGKKLMTDSQFTIFAEGSNNKTSVAGLEKPSPFTAGGHLDTANTAMISGFFGEECCGLVWQWLDELAPTGESAWNAYANTERGQSYGMPYVLRAGGYWGLSAVCGSWSRDSVSTRSTVSAVSGARGVSRCLPWNYFD